MKSRFLAAAFCVLAIFLQIGCSAGSGQPAAPPYWPTHGWRNSAPEDQGFDPAKLAEALLAMRERNIHIHSLMILRNGYVVLEAYFYPYDGTTVHELASVTKSVMTTLIAIAADQGSLGLDQPMISFFPGRVIANRDGRKERITVRHLAAMTSGLDCSSEHDERTLDEMGRSPDWVQFTLDRRVVHDPGERFVYCSPGTHVLSAILQNATGLTALQFARINLFGPLGIEEVLWDVDPQGYNDGWAGLYLHPRDVAKLGCLWLWGGRWEGEQLVSRKWVEESVKRRTTTGMGDDYGYGWWVMPQGGVRRRRTQRAVYPRVSSLEGDRGDHRRRLHLERHRLSHRLSRGGHEQPHPRQSGGTGTAE